MMEIPILIWIVILITAVSYFLLISLFSWGFRKLPKHHSNDFFTEKEEYYHTMSIIIAARNEEQNILKCLRSIAIQDYPKDLFELIIVNDQSNDTTGNIVDHFIESTPIKARQLYTSGKGGKKEALRIGIIASKGSKVITTDADCVVSPCWIKEMNRCFQSTDAVYITGPVMMNPINGIFNKFQCLEFNSLIASTAGSIGLGMPIMCNGANMGFSLEAYHELSAHQLPDVNAVGEKPADVMNQSIASGDDVFLMLAMKKYYGTNRIAFVNSFDAIVYTDTQQSIQAFINQRLRWVSKSSGYTDRQIIFTAVSIFSFNLVLLFLTIASILHAILMLTSPSAHGCILPAITCGLFLLKTLVDSILLSPYLRKFGQYKLLRILPIMEPLVMLYTVAIGIAGNFISFRWKDRVMSGTNQ